MSLRHRAFISRQTVVRPSVTSAKDAAGYFVGTEYLCPRNSPPLCILGSNLVVKTSLKEQPEQACYLRVGREHRSRDSSKHLRRRGGSAGSQTNLDFLEAAGAPALSCCKSTNQCRGQSLRGCGAKSTRCGSVRHGGCFATVPPRVFHRGRLAILEEMYRPIQSPQVPGRKPIPR